VGFAAGGPTDTGARILADRLKTLLGQPVVVENVTGANGSIGVGRVVRAVPDGHTLSLGDLGTHVVNQATYSLPYDLQKDMLPIALLRTGSYLVVARVGMPIQAGKLKAYAVMGKNRLAATPEIPTVDEAGTPGAHYLSWSSLWAPRGTPTDIIARLNAAVVEASADPILRARYAELAADVPPPDQQTPEALAHLQKAEIEKWWPIIKAANLKVE